MEHEEEIILSHSQKFATMEERLAGLDRRILVVEDGISSLAQKFDRQGWMLAGVLGGVLLELALMMLKH